MRKTKLGIKRVTIGGKRYWQVVSPKMGGGRQRRTFKLKADAEAYRELIQVQLENFGTAGASMSEKLRGDALAAAEVLKPFGHSLLDAAKHYAKHLASITGGIPLSEALRLLLLDREKPTYSEVYRKTLGHCLNRFVTFFPKMKTSRQVTPVDVEEFLGVLLAKGRSTGTLETYRKHIFTLFSFLQQRGFSSENPARHIKKEKVLHRIQILSPAQCAKLLHACDNRTLPSIAIGMFCGLRSSELARLDWSRVKLSERVIIIDPIVARKTMSRRVVRIPENCAEWLLRHAKESGPIQPSNFRNLRDCVRVKAGFKPSYENREFEELQNAIKEAKSKRVKLQEWPGNCLRHTAISYALADSRDESKVASWAGNSPSIIKEHYDSQAMPSEAKAFYDIRPSTPANVVAMKKSKAA
jgi:integrase